MSTISHLRLLSSLHESLTTYKESLAGLDGDLGNSEMSKTEQMGIADGRAVINLSSRRCTETLQGNLRLSRAADNDGRRQGSTRTRLKL